MELTSSLPHHGQAYMACSNSLRSIRVYPTLGGRTAPLVTTDDALVTTQRENVLNVGSMASKIVVTSEKILDERQINELLLLLIGLLSGAIIYASIRAKMTSKMSLIRLAARVPKSM